MTEHEVYICASCEEAFCVIGNPPACQHTPPVCGDCWDQCTPCYMIAKITAHSAGRAS